MDDVCRGSSDYWVLTDRVYRVETLPPPIDREETRARWAALPARTPHDALRQLDEADALAFPVHVVAASLLEVSSCPRHAVSDQWRKAAARAGTPGAAQIAADGLWAAVDGRRDLTEVQRLVRHYALAEPWHASNLQRVDHALQERVAAK